MALEKGNLAPEKQSTREDWLLQRLLASGNLNQADAEHVRQLCTTRKESLPRLLLHLGIVPEAALAQILAEFHETTIVSETDIPQKPLENYDFSAKFLRSSQSVPLYEQNDEIIVAMVDPGDRYAVDSIKMLCAKRVRALAAPKSLILDTIERLYGSTKATVSAPISKNVTHQWQDRIESSPVAARVSDLISKAVGARASDIHLEQSTRETRIRFRIDGVLHDIDKLDNETGTKACARVKLISNLDVAERRMPQDGRFQFDTDGEQIDMRVSSMPINGGESIVLRILHRSHTQVELENLGFSTSVTHSIKECLRGGRGLLMVTGPTGSGKSTTLYSALAKLNSSSKKLVTVEDPMEYDLEGVNQIQVRPELRLTFAAALRSVLRQDPDIIMVGEVRDADTADITIQAALTGHLVLTTLHTNDAASSFPRLIDMGVEPYLLASTVSGVLAQRLVRRLCSHCRSHSETNSAEYDWFGVTGIEQTGATIFTAVGCDRCAGTGYFGRTAVGEFIKVDDAMSQLIRGNAGNEFIMEEACKRGTLPLMRDAARRVHNGDTTMGEVMRCLG